MSHLSKKRKAESEMEQEPQSVDTRSTTHADGTTTQELLHFLIQANAHDPAFANMLQNEWAKAQVGVNMQGNNDGQVDSKPPAQAASCPASPGVSTLNGLKAACQEAIVMSNENNPSGLDLSDLIAYANDKHRQAVTYDSEGKQLYNELNHELTILQQQKSEVKVTWTPLKEQLDTAKAALDPVDKELKVIDAWQVRYRQFQFNLNCPGRANNVARFEELKNTLESIDTGAEHPFGKITPKQGREIIGARTRVYLGSHELSRASQLHEAPMFRPSDILSEIDYLDRNGYFKSEAVKTHLGNKKRRPSREGLHLGGNRSKRWLLKELAVAIDLVDDIPNDYTANPFNSDGGHHNLPPLPTL